MQTVPVMDCGDNIVRAEMAFYKQSVAKTAAYTIAPSEIGTHFTNRGASASVTFTLPPPKAGAQLRFSKAVASQNLVVTTDVAGTKLHGGSGMTQGVTLTNSTATEYGSLHLLSDGTAWFAFSQAGTWAVS